MSEISYKIKYIYEFKNITHFRYTWVSWYVP